MFGLRVLWRDWRGGELGILAAALIVAVAIVSGISLFADRLQQGINTQSSHFLAADRVLQSSRPIAPDWLDKARHFGLEQARVIQFQSMVYSGEGVDAAMQLASVKAVSFSYPLLGQLDISDQGFAESYKTSKAPALGEVWLDSRLLALMQLSIGDKLYVGEKQLQITQVVNNEPDRGSSFSGFGPRVLMNAGDIPATHIIQPGSRVEYRYLFAGEPQPLGQYGQWLQPLLQPGHKWLQLKDTQPRIAQSLNKAEQFLLLAGSLGVGLAGIAIALAARRYSERHYDYVAIMKSLGASSRQIMAIYSINLLLLAVLATLMGCGLGWVIQQLFISLLAEYLAVPIVPEISLRPFWVGSITALVSLLAFALPPLVSLLQVSPLRVLRRDLPQSNLSELLSYVAGVIGISLLMLWYSGDLTLTLLVLSGVGLTFAVVGGVAWYILRGTATLGMQAGSAWRLALANLRRRGFQSAVQVVIFSLSIMLLLVLALMRSSLIEDWQVQLPEGTPNHFLVNVAESEVKAVDRLLREHELKSEPIYPMVRGRMTQINNEQVSLRVTVDDPSQEARLDRELNLTWSETLPNGNQLLAGKWWSAGSGVAEVSIESELADRLNIVVGDELQFQVGSEQLEATVSSIRQLDWESMRPNFYVIFPAALLQQYPATYITSFYLPEQKKPFLNEFLRRFPTITVIEMDAVIKQVRTIINQVSSAVELVLSLIIVSGLLVLLAGVQSSLDSRFQESAILRTLGASRRLVLGSLAIEFVFLGGLAGLLAAFAAELSVYGLQESLLAMEYVAHPWVWLVGPLIGAMLIGTAGYGSCCRVVNTPPVVVLREL